MFDPNSKDTAPSLLMRARQGRQAEATGAHKAGATGARQGRRANPLLSALSRRRGDAAGKDNSPETGADRPRRPAGVTGAGSPPGRQPPHGADNGGRGDASGAPLVDPVALIATMWRWRLVVLALTLAGAIVGVIVALATPHRYTAYSEVLIDPREVQLVGRDLEREFLANEAALAIVDSRLSLVRSRPVLERVIENTNLDQDPEFSGTGDDGFLAGLDFLVSLFGEAPPVETDERVTLENLRDAIEIDRTTRTFVVTIGVEAGSPSKAALLANEVTRAFIEEQGSISADKAREANTALTGRLDELQANVEQAERRIEEFRAANGLVSAQGRLLTDDDLSAASNQLAEARAATIRARSNAEEARSITIDDAISGSVPADLNTGALNTFRAQLASLRQNAAQLENQLGPRHPRLASAQAAIEAARQDIAGELRRIVQGAQSELRRAVQTEQELAAELARAKAAKAGQSDALVNLRDLQAEAEAARAVYNGALLRARETGEIGTLGTVNAAVLAEAEPPLYASSVSRRTIAVAYTLAGLLAGLAVAFLAGLRSAVRLDMLAGAQDGPGRPVPDDPRPTRNAHQESQTMHPSYPYAGHPAYPSAQPQASAAPQGGWPHHPDAYAGWSHPAPPQPPVQQWPQPAPHPAYGPAGHGAPMPPAPWPAHGQPQWAGQPAPMSAPAQPQRQEEAGPAQASELAEIRRAIGEIREVVEELAARRSGNVRRFG